MEQVCTGTLSAADRRPLGGKERPYHPSGAKRTHENSFLHHDADERFDGLAEEHKVLSGKRSGRVGMAGGRGGLMARPHPGN